MSLVDLLNQVDAEAEELTKLAQEEEAAGRIMARGFMDELNKLAQTGAVPPAAPAVPPSLKRGKIKHTNQSITTPMAGGQGSQTKYIDKNLTVKRPKESVDAFAKSLPK